MAKQNDQGNAIREGVHDGRHRVASPWPFGHQGDSRLARASRVTVSHVYRRLLMPGENQRDFRARVKGVEQGKNVVPGQGRDELNALGLQDLNDDVRDPHVGVIVGQPVAPKGRGKNPLPPVFLQTSDRQNPPAVFPWLTVPPRQESPK